MNWENGAWIPVFIAAITAAAVLLAVAIANKAFPLWYRSLRFTRYITPKGTGDNALDQVIKTVGYEYDARQDIFYSHLDAWQRKYGYCRLYDEAAAPLGMIVDCEPVCFEYDGRIWMIEFWKGQYDLTTGCEVGVYIAEEPYLKIPGIFSGYFYNCARDGDLLRMSLILKKNGKKLFHRSGKHWWLTGFRLGEFSETWELTMDIGITLKNSAMCDAFVKALKEAGYQDGEIKRNRSTVKLRYDKPRARQPFSRTDDSDWLIQRKNELLCGIFRKATESFHKMPDKIQAIQDQFPELYGYIENIGKNAHLYSQYEVLKKYMGQRP